jgi:hypothetical protein
MTIKQHAVALDGLEAEADRQVRFPNGGGAVCDPSMTQRFQIWRGTGSRPSCGATLRSIGAIKGLLTECPVSTRSGPSPAGTASCSFAYSSAHGRRCCSMRMPVSAVRVAPHVAHRPHGGGAVSAHRQPVELIDHFNDYLPALWQGGIFEGKRYAGRSMCRSTSSTSTRRS